MTLQQMPKQTRPPDFVLVAASGPNDVASGWADLRYGLIYAEKGLTTQRNALLTAASKADIIIFFDDDFLPHPTYIEEVEKAHLNDDDIAMTTGFVMLDGIIGPGIAYDFALRRLQNSHKGTTDAQRLQSSRTIYNAYGCNMSVNAALARRHGVSFDVRLPLYGWQEDVDFSRRMARYGKIVQIPAARGIHLGVKKGRVTGVRFGYSQIANPLYLFRKGTINLKHFLVQVSRKRFRECGKTAVSGNAC